MWHINCIGNNEPIATDVGILNHSTNYCIYLPKTVVVIKNNSKQGLTREQTREIKKRRKKQAAKKWRENQQNSIRIRMQEHIIFILYIGTDNRNNLLVK